MTTRKARTVSAVFFLITIAALLATITAITAGAKVPALFAVGAAIVAAAISCHYDGWERGHKHARSEVHHCTEECNPPLVPERSSTPLS